MDIPRFGIPEKRADRMSMAEQHDYLRARLTRRGVLRTSVATAAVAGAGLGTGLAASPAYAAPTVPASRRTSTQVDGSPVAPFGRHLAYGADPRTQKALYNFPVPDTYEGHVQDLDSVDTYHAVKGGGKATETVEWSRVRYTGFSFLAVEVEPGRHARMKVTALAESGERIDHFEIRRG
ncbi:hypothetical protein OG520_11650 [Streptomyces sp. NBC_00984]|nr:hypothetical protein OG520_11650 [Streptomyces sp. NBC_00984]